MHTSFLVKQSFSVKFLLTVFVSLLLSSCNFFDDDGDIFLHTSKEIALEKIIAYAEDGSRSVPTLQDYINAGVTGVTNENLAKINAAVDALEMEDVDSVTKLDTLTTQLDINIIPIVDAGDNTTIEVNKSIQITGIASDSDGNITSYVWSNGVKQLATTAAFTYTPTTVGTDTLTLTVTDNDGATASASVIVVVTAIAVPNKAPSVNAGPDTTVEVNKSIQITGSGSDSDGNITAYAWNKGASQLATTATFTYTPRAVGTDTLTLTVTDNDGATASDSINIIVTARINIAPTAVEQAITLDEDVVTNIILTGSDDVSVSSYTVVAQPSNGILGGTAPNLSYTPTANYNGTDSFTFSVKDTEGAVSETATVSITVNAVNDEIPVATSQNISTDENEAKSMTLTGSDDGSISSYTVVTQPSKGTLTGTAPNLTYTPTAEYLGADSFTFTVTDDEGATSPIATISIDVQEKVVSQDVFSVLIGSGFPYGSFWYLGDKQWERSNNSTDECSAYTETGRDVTSIYLTDASGTVTVTMNIDEMTVSSNIDPKYLQILDIDDSGQGESPANCPSNTGTNDFKPMMTSASEVEVFDGKNEVMALRSKDLDKPRQDLMYALTENTTTDNELFTLDGILLVFIDAPDVRNPQDADFNNIYVVEVEVSDGFEGSKTRQTIQVTVKPVGNFIGRAGTACRAGLQNEGNPKDINNGSYFTIRNDLSTLHDCRAECDKYPLRGSSVNCTGVEYRAEGADYADLQSRCELWKVPIVATTPQKEYGCYLRESVRDSYGPAIDTYAGVYKAFDIAIDGESVGATMTLSTLSSTELLWEAEDGKSWTVTRTVDRSKLATASDYPYIGDGYENIEVTWEADEIIGIVGPSGLIYRTAWAYAKKAQSIAVYREFINNHPSELSRVEEAERLIRELKWGIAEQINTAAAYRAYKADIDGAYGRTQEADIRIASFKAFVTAEVLKIGVDEDVPALGENNDLELFYNLEFTKNWKKRADESSWDPNSVLLTSINQSDGSKITNINDGADRAFEPAGNAEKSIEATENETLRYGGLMFEVDSEPEGFVSEQEHQEKFDDCSFFGPGDFETRTCAEIYSKPLYKRWLYSNTPVSLDYSPFVVDGIFSSRWSGHRTWAGNATNVTDSLTSSYATIAMEDLEYQIPKRATQTIAFESDEEISILYEFTKRTEEQQNEFIAANALKCEDPVLKRGKLKSRYTIDAPGFIIRNETDHTYSVSLNQVGPLYYGELSPGKIFKRDTAWGHFTIDAKLNITGEQRYSDWDVAGPIAQFTAEVLLSVYTAGTPISSFRLAIQAAGKKGIASLTAKAAASGLSSNIFGRALLRAGVEAIKLVTVTNPSAKIRIATSLARVAGKEIVLESIDYDTDDAFDAAFSSDLADNVYKEENTEEDRSWSYSRGWPSTVQMYHIVGGPRLPCLAENGDLEIRSSKLQILDDEECAANRDICTMY